jgi:acyl-CoA synthetase (AMP-forming)/AMP-acid ligase II
MFDDSYFVSRGRQRMYFDRIVRRLTQQGSTDLAKAAVVGRAQVGDDTSAEVSLSYAELDRAARVVAAWLTKRCEPGERVLLLSPLGPEVVKNFFGCLYAGVVPVVAPVP